jgi:SpoU rRNA methylase family enzyme
MMVNGMVKVKRIRLEDTKEWLVFAEIDDDIDGDILAVIKPDVKLVLFSNLNETNTRLR